MADFCPQFVPNVIYKQKSESNLLITLTFLVPEIGFEPIRLLNRGILSPLRLPIPPLGHIYSFFTVFIQYEGF